MNDQVPSASWGANQRLKYIDSKLYWEGRINRSDLAEAFSISVQQASSDISSYHVAAPDNLLYDPRLKGYISSGTFSPLFEVTKPGVYLSELAGGKRDSSAEKWSTPVQELPRLERRLDSSVVRTILSAIRSNSGVEISYHSMSRPEVTKRWIDPHSIATDGDRWHVRAYCYNREAFLDFSLVRIVAAGDKRKANFSSDVDLDWQTYSEVVFVPHPKMKEPQRTLLAEDYEMDGGKLIFQVRNAMLLYLLVRFGREQSQEAEDPNRFQIVLASESELRAKQAASVGRVRNTGPVAVGFNNG